MTYKKYLKLFILNKTLIVIFVLSLLLRTINPTFGSPVLYVIGDEAANYMDALYMVAGRNLFVDNSIYPPFGSFFQIPFLLIAFLGTLVFGKFNSIAGLELFLLTNQGYFLFVPRLISGIFGALTVFVIYQISGKFFPSQKKVAILSALLCAFTFTHIQVSHFARPWSPALFFLILSILFSIKTLELNNNERKNVLLASVFTIISFGFHQVGILGIWFFILVKFFHRGIKLFARDIYFIFGILFSIAGIAIIYFINSQGPSQGFFRDTFYYPADATIYFKIIDILKNNSFFYLLKEFIINEPILLVFFVVSLLVYKTYKKQATIGAIFISTTFLVICFSMWQLRYMLPIMLLMAPYAAVGIIKVLEFLRNPFAKVVIWICLLTLATTPSLIWNYLYLQEPTFIQAKSWIEENVPPSEVILTTSLKFTSFAPAKDVLEIQQKNYPGFYQKAGSKLQYGEYPENVRNIVYLDKFENINHKDRVPKLLENFPIQYKYIIDMYWDPTDSRMLLVDKNKFIKAQSFWPISKNDSQYPVGQILATSVPPFPFIMFSLQRAGPYVDIYMRKNAL